MSQLTRKSFLVTAGFVLAISAPLASAANVVSMELTGPPPGPSLGGVYISPYTALIGPAGQTTAPISGVETTVICDDFTTDVSTGTPPWQAIVTNLGSLQGETSADTDLKFDKTSSTQQQTDYTVAALLATEILQAQTGGNVTAEGELSYALWGLFDTGTGSSDPFGGNFITGTTLTDAKHDLQLAQLQVASSHLTPASFSNVTVYSPSPQNASQEYIVVSMPEPSAPALLALYLTAVLIGLAFVFRGRTKSVKR